MDFDPLVQTFSTKFAGLTGDAGKGIVAVLLLVGLVLMIIGYRGAPLSPFGHPHPSWCM